MAWHLQHCCNPTFSEGREEYFKLSGLHENHRLCEGRKQTMFWFQSAARQEASVYPHQYPCPVTLALAQQHSFKVCVMYVCVDSRGRERWGREELLNPWASSTSIYPSNCTDCSSSLPPKPSTSLQGRKNTLHAAAYVTPSRSDRKDCAELCFQRREGRK